MNQYVVREHKGRSGKSVYGFRVYSEWTQYTDKIHRTQLGKFRTREAAERAAEHYRSHAAKVAAR